MFTFSSIIWMFVVITVIYCFWTYLFYPLFIDGFINGIYEAVKEEDGDFSFLYLLKKVWRYLRWTIVLIGWAFFAGPIMIKIFDYVIFDLLFEAIKNLIGIS